MSTKTSYTPSSSSSKGPSLKKAVKKHMELDGCGKKVAMYVGITTVVALMLCWACYAMGKSNQKKEDETASRAAASKSRANDQHMKSEIERLQKLLSVCRGGGSMPASTASASARKYLNPPSKN